jgi:hypothetical protein
MNNSVLRKAVRPFVPRQLRGVINQWVGEYRTSRSPDRIFLKDTLLPEVGKRGGRVLFVGCQRYTAGYPRILDGHGAECWTIDIDPAAARWGAMGRHTVLDARYIAQHFSSEFFDTVVLSGVFGFGVDTDLLQNTVLVAVNRVLKCGGLLVLGWNTDRSPDPMQLDELQRRFNAGVLGGLGSRRTFQGTTHVFDFLLTKKSADGSDAQSETGYAARGAHAPAARRA